MEHKIPTSTETHETLCTIVLDLIKISDNISKVKSECTPHAQYYLQLLQEQVELVKFSLSDFLESMGYPKSGLNATSPGAWGGEGTGQ